MVILQKAWDILTLKFLRHKAAIDAARAEYHQAREQFVRETQGIEDAAEQASADVITSAPSSDADRLAEALADTDIDYGDRDG